MKLYFKGHDFRYAAEQMMLTLFPSQRPEYPEGEPDGAAPAALLTLERDGDALYARSELWWEGGHYIASRTERPREGEDERRAAMRLVRLAFYDAGVQALGGEPPWGALTGVRPVKLPTKWMSAGESAETARSRLRELYRVEPGRAALTVDCARAALDTKRGIDKQGVSLYIGIPFCPTRCAYCSFISADVQRALVLVEPYVDALCREIALTGRLLRERGLYVHTAYMGGGTPTTLSAGQLERVLGAARRELPMERCRELTVEAGRPDTITGEKLAVLREQGVERISINPQSMDNAVLRAMGRAHTAEEIEAAMELSRTHFGGLVNMDLIAGLPTDSPAGFARTLERVLDMGPDNVTVHTLALKKGARLMERPEGLCSGEDVAAMLGQGEVRLRGAGYAPYYLYRQKYMSGSFENVGWCRAGTVCAYNIIMMEELQTVLSLGAGGITKLVDPGTGRITRLSNPKYPTEYLNSWERIAADKAVAADFQQALAARG